MTSMTIKGVVADAQEAYETAGEGGTAWGDLSDHQRGLVAMRLGEVRRAIAELDQAKVALEEILRTKPVGEDDEEIAGFKVSTSPNRRLDDKRLMNDFPEGDHPNLYKVALDSAAVKRAIAPDELDAYYNEGEPRLNFKAL